MKLIFLDDWISFHGFNDSFTHDFIVNSFCLINGISNAWLCSLFYCIFFFILIDLPVIVDPKVWIVCFTLNNRILYLQLITLIFSYFGNILYDLFILYLYLLNINYWYSCCIFKSERIFLSNSMPFIVQSFLQNVV